MNFASANLVEQIGSSPKISVKFEWEKNEKLD